MLRKWAWLLVIFLIGTLFFLSSIPGLSVLPILSTINSIMVSLDLTFVNISRWLADQLPMETGDIYYLDAATQDFLAYASENPVIIEFLLRKLAHILFFFAITIALFFLLHQYIRNSYVAVIVAFFGSGLISVLDEYRQTFVPERYGSVFDVIINMVGVSLAVMLILFSLFITRSGRKKFTGLTKGPDTPTETFTEDSASEPVTAKEEEAYHEENEEKGIEKYNEKV